MKKGVLACLLTISVTGYCQTVLYSENFQTGNSFTLNTADVSSNPSGYNQWLVNNTYTGGGGSLICLGFPFTFTVPNTPMQPAAISGSPFSNYLHTASNAAMANGINNCCFLAADGICHGPENYFARMSTDVNTTGYDTVYFSFWWLCQGGTNSYGEVYYSLNSGNTWTKITTPISNYFNQGGWTYQNITLPVFANQPALRFGFRFVNQLTLAASDPGFAIDEIRITGIQNIVIPVANFTSNIQTFCEESCVNFFDLSTNNPTSWQWSFPGGIPSTSTQQNPFICYSAPGSYDVTLVACNSNGCDTLTIPGFIVVNPNPPSPQLTINSDTICATFNPGYSYQWYYNVNTLIPGATNYCYVAIFPGSYHVVVTDPNGCIASSDTVLITGIHASALSPEFSLSLTTSPVSHTITMDVVYYSEQPGKIQVIDAAGRNVFTDRVPARAGRFIFKTTELAPGIYQVRLSNGFAHINKKAMIY
jgi:PKD repeat protein